MFNLVSVIQLRSIGQTYDAALSVNLPYWSISKGSDLRYKFTTFHNEIARPKPTEKQIGNMEVGQKAPFSPYNVTCHPDVHNRPVRVSGSHKE